MTVTVTSNYNPGLGIIYLDTNKVEPGTVLYTEEGDELFIEEHDNNNTYFTSSKLLLLAGTKLTTIKTSIFPKLSMVEFNKYYNRRMDLIKSVLQSKGEEYSVNEDRLSNFNSAGRIANITRERALDGMLLKHYTSYRDMLDDIDNGKLPTVAKLEEKLGDLIVYFILQEVSIKHKIDNDTNNNVNNPA